MRYIKILSIIMSLVIICLAQTFTPQWVIEDAFKKELLKFNDINSITPDELKNAMEKYHQSKFRDAADVLEKLRTLNLPDNRLDFVAFALAECYRQMNVKTKAMEQYHYVLNNFQSSDKTGAALYRILEYAVEEDNIEKVDSICLIFQTSLRKHDLYNSALYLTAKSYYYQKRFGEVIQLLSQIGRNSSVYFKAVFLTALSEFHLKNEKEALAMLEQIRKNSNDIDLSSEATVLIGDTYYNQNKINSAISYYNLVPSSASRYQYALLKAAHACLDLKRYRDAERTALKFLDKFPQSNYYFEIASILDQAYTKNGKEQDALYIKQRIDSQIIENRLLFDIYEEIDRVTDIIKGWQIIEYSAIRKQNKDMIITAQDRIKRTKSIESRLRQLLQQISHNESDDNTIDTKAVPYLAERRYMTTLKRRNAVLSDSISIVSEIVRQASGLSDDTQKQIKIDSITSVLDSMKSEYSFNEKEYALIIKECLVGDKDSNRKNGELQARLIDWAFVNYQNKKEILKKLTEKISLQEKKKKDDIKIADDNPSINLDSAITERNKLINIIADERDRLTDHILVMLEIYPRNIYNAQIYYRLAELYFDAAGDDFQKKLIEYESQMASGKDSVGLEFPEYSLDKVIGTYQKIIDSYPENSIADDACFFKALALKKLGRDSLANVVFMDLIKKYPDSEYFVESNMNIGRYYFDHPKEEDNQGYKFAEDAFRKVLNYKDHPQYIQALYHLGWCYYMQDHYDDAISVFKYLVQEGKLDFDQTGSEDKQVANPLLRGEAIDYIAISFDEDDRIDDAHKFLQLIGNQDYSALIFKRIAELREEDLDFKNAVNVYRKLLKEYPLSSAAPDAMIKIMSLYESQNQPDSAILIRKEFYNMYSKGSDWQKRNLQIDSLLVRKIDSLSIETGLYYADDSYRNAEKTGSVKDYEIAAKNYQQIVEKYGNKIRAEDASWNLAAVLDLKLGNKIDAYKNYLEFSRNEKYNLSKREQAALNAFATAQALLSPDSIDSGKVFNASVAMIVEASDNYCNLFPSGGSYSQVIFGTAAVYFNRKKYEDALLLYDKINKLGPADKNYYESLGFSGQCFYGMEKYASAVEMFEKIWKDSDDLIKRNEAFKLLLESAFLNAQKMFDAKEYQKAATAFKSIEEKYPGSNNCDIALYRAGESFEKLELWDEACINYYNLVNKYPSSKLAPDALFNAALCYEKAGKFQRAADTYELLASGYPGSEKAKDALFNVSFCYEKLGMMDKMAESNERYSSMYPGEKDVEALLLRSAGFYLKTSLYDKAITVYRNFIFRYPRSVKSVEAQYMIGKCYLEQGDRINAVLSFEQVEPHNSNLNKDGFEGNHYYAAEAAFQIASLKREELSLVKIALPDDQLKAAVKIKSDLILDAVKAYQRVIQYHSEKMFEASYRIGEMYQDFSDAYKNQERPKLDPIKSAVLEKDIYTLSSQLLQKAISPYRKTIQLAAEFDKLNSEQSAWVNRAKNGLIYCYSKAGEYLVNAVDEMKKAPVPNELHDKPLHIYQYLKQLFETLAPMKEIVIKYYSTIINQVDSLHAGDSTAIKIRDEYARNNFLMGSDYDDLSVQILKKTEDLPRSISEDEREELLFQLEDIVFELQDKAILSYEDAINRLQENNLSENRWYSRIWESLARLSPDKYGKSFFSSFNVSTGKDWVVRPDSVGKWNTKNVPAEGWYAAIPAKSFNVNMSEKNCKSIWGEEQWTNVYIWKHLFIGGAPNNTSIYVSSPGKYKLYINGVLTINDTVGIRGTGVMDSATGIDALVHGGDNILALEVQRNTDSKKGIAVLFTALVDTTKKFKSDIKLPVVKDEKNDTAVVNDTTVKAETVYKDTAHKNRKDLQKAIDEFNAREKIANDLIKKESLEIQKLKMKIEAIDLKLKAKQKTGAGKS